jgi:hypothetical protein
MMVWGGQDDSSIMSSGGRYGLGISVDNDGDGVGNCDGDCDDAEASVYPGASQVCDGLNNDCNDPLWPGLDGTNERDDDGDALSECQGDCDDTDDQFWDTPGEVTGLILSHTGGELGTSTLDWSAPVTGGTAASMAYDTIRSNQPSDFLAADCVEANDGPNTTSTDSFNLAPGVVFYLIRAQNPCPNGLGSLGLGAAGQPRTGLDCP